MKKLSHNHEGFTLIELLVVIAIIGVLAAVVLLAINPAQMLRRGRDSQRQSDMTNLRKAIDLYMVTPATTGTNPTSLPGCVDGGAACTVDMYSNAVQGSAAGNCCAGTAGAVCSASANSGWLAATATDCNSGAAATDTTPDLSAYVAKIPTDPVNSATYRYRYQVTGGGATSQTYSLTAKIENNPSATNCFQTGTYVPGSFCW